METNVNTTIILKDKIISLFTTYKGILIFILPVILMLIVGSVVVNNKPESMKATLMGSALANLICLGFITNVFIVFGLEYIDFKSKVDNDKDLTIGTIKLIIWNITIGIFNTIYLMFITWIFTDVSKYMSPNFFVGSNIDWGGVIFSISMLCILSITLTLIIANLLTSKKTYAIIGLLYFLGFGYLAGGMFGPGATYWMMFPALFMPHTYIAHFLSASFTNGTYDVAHLPTKGDIVILIQYYENHIGELINGIINGNLDFSSLFLTHGSSIWDLTVWQPQRWIYDSYGNKMYNNFYQINAANIFLPIVISFIAFNSFIMVKKFDIKI